MNGWLIVNSFIDISKFTELYSLLLDAAKSYGISLKLMKGDAICDIVGGKFEDRPLPDFALFWDKDVMLAQLLEDAGLRLFNSAYAIDVCDNKSKTYIQLARSGVRIPKTVLAPKTFEGFGYNDLGFLDTAIEKLGLPMIIKEAFGSFGQQVYLANTRYEAVCIIEAIGYKDFVLQEFVAGSIGKDLRISVVGDRAVAGMLRYNDHDFRSNITNGGAMKRYTPSKEQEEVAVAAARALKADFAGVDILLGEDGEPIICEVNSNPHFKSTLDCTGVNLAEHIMEYIQVKQNDKRHTDL